MQFCILEKKLRQNYEINLSGMNKKKNGKEKKKEKQEMKINIFF